jgi:hypothetical protein
MTSATGRRLRLSHCNPRSSWRFADFQTGLVQLRLHQLSAAQPVAGQVGAGQSGYGAS